MGLLGASIVAMLVGVVILGLLVARFWMRVMWRVATFALALAAFGALAGVVWLWVAH
jgi:hypothetical protein